MLRKPKYPFVAKPLRGKVDKTFVPCPLFQRDPERKFIPTPLRKDEGEVHEQCNTVPS